MTRTLLLVSALVFSALPTSAIAGPAENKAVASRVILEKMGQGRFDIQPEIYGPDFVAHGFGRDFTLAEDEASGKQLRAAFTDLQLKLDRVIAEGDLVSLHWSAKGTNTVAIGPFPGTGKAVAVDGMSFFRFADGKIVEEWSTYDNLTIMQQLGMIPAK
jgi:hypothetical protein